MIRDERKTRGTTLVPNYDGHLGWIHPEKGISTSLLTGDDPGALNYISHSVCSSGRIFNRFACPAHTIPGIAEWLKSVYSFPSSLY